MIKINYIALISVFLAGVLINDALDMVGTISKPTEYTYRDTFRFLVFILLVFLIGKLSKFKRL